MSLDEQFRRFIESNTERFTPSEETVKQAIDIIRTNVRDYVKENNLKSLVVGLSGGLDSSVVAALCQEKYIGVPLIGLSMPLGSTAVHIKQATIVGSQFCSAFFETSLLEDAQDGLQCALAESDKALSKYMNDVTKGLRRGNMRSRMRMIKLYDTARKVNGIVLGTGNWSEDYATFFYTLGGDGQVDYSPIKGINKGFEMPVFAEILGIHERIINQSPSDGLGVTDGNTDESQIGANYKEVDIIVNIYLGNADNNLKFQFEKFIELDKVQKVLTRYEFNKYKLNGEIEILREDLGLAINYKY